MVSEKWAATEVDIRVAKPACSDLDQHFVGPGGCIVLFADLRETFPSPVNLLDANAGLSAPLYG